MNYYDDDLKKYAQGIIGGIDILTTLRQPNAQIIIVILYIFLFT